MWRWLSPGDVVCDWVGLAEEDDNRMVLRMYVNIIVWGAVLSAVALTFAIG
ncbi:MAG: hypothetical protein AAFZ05_13100 [Pseudomonadota bacterium]